jgi:hypothetical protein
MPFVKKHSPLNPKTILIGGPDTGGPIWTSTIIANSGVVQIGDPVEVVQNAAADGHVVQRLTAVTDMILGVVTGVRNGDGTAVTADSGTNDTFTVAADNETVLRKYAIVDITPNAVWSAPFTGTIHTTVRFAGGVYCDLGVTTACDTIDETTCTATLVQGRQVVALGPDPDNTARGLVIIGTKFIDGGNAI